MQVMAHYPLDSNSTFPGNGAKNACCHFLTQLPSKEVLSPSLATAPKMLVDTSNAT
jgi:hypothetical protein